MGDPADPRDAFLEAAFWHGDLAAADGLLAAHPNLAEHDVYVAATLGDAATVSRLVQQDPACATAAHGPHGRDALTCLCFSRYLRLDPSRSERFLAAATTLLDAGASANTGWFETSHQPTPCWESALYGACGVAHHAGLTRLLLARGADPNDGETPYHAPETRDNDALQALLDSGKLTADSLATLLLRKADWHDRAGLALLLQHGADPNRQTVWGYTALQQAVRRDNELASIELLLQHGADPTLPSAGGAGSAEPGPTAMALAARRGRRDVLELLPRRGVAVELHGVEALLAACACDSTAAVNDLLAHAPGLRAELLAEGGRALAEFSGTGNAAGARQLLDLGVPVTATYGGDGYFDVAPDSLALHVAAWRLQPDVMALLVERGSPLDARDGRGQTPLLRAVAGCISSYWSERRSPQCVEVLLRAGASPAGIDLPTGYPAADALLVQYT